MRAVALAAVLAIVLAASALNLALGVLWVAALLAVWLGRRRVRAAAWLVLLVVLGGGAAAARLGWLAKPAPASYGADELAWLRARLGRLAPARPEAPGSPGASERARLAAVRAEELGESAGELLRRAEAAVAAGRDAAGLRARAAAEVAAVEAAARQLALTLAAPEFRDLEGRRARLVEWLAAVEERLRTATDPADLAAAARALAPAPMAPVSLRALREDLARAEVALAGLARAVAGAPLSHAATVAFDYDERRGELVEEQRHRFEVPPALRIRRLDLRPLDRGPGGADVSRTLAYAADGGPPRGLGGAPELVLAAPGGVQVLLLERRVRRLHPDPLATALRRLPFRRLELPGGPQPAPLFGVTVAVDRGAGPVLPLRTGGGAPRLEAVALPPRSFHYASRPGSVEADGGHDRWRPADTGVPGPLEVELISASRLLRNAWFVRLKDYLYTPNPAAALAAAGLAALAAILVRRRPAAPPPGSPPR